MRQSPLNNLYHKLIILVFTTALVLGLTPDGGPVTDAQTTSFTVNSTTDATDANPGDGVCETAAGNGVCTLRAAIQETNALAGADTVILPSGVYTLTIAGVLENLAEFGDLDITDDLTITGAGPDNTIIDGNALDRVFHILGDVTVEIAGVTIQNGNTVLASEDGASIYNEGTLTLRDSTILTNHAGNGGGGIYNSGRLTLTHSTVSGNSATYGGGIFNTGWMALANSTIRGNSAIRSDGNGGGIVNSGRGKLTLDSSILSGNQANRRGGGIYNGSILTLTDSTVSGNSATEGGGIYNLSATGIVTLNHSTVSSNSATDGGGIFNGYMLILTYSSVDGNSARATGGGIVNFYYGRLTLTHSTVSGNSATDGGGIHNTGWMALANSSFSGNSANGSGGGIYHGSKQSDTLNLSNVTITNNSADSDGDEAGDGGGLFNQVGLVNVRHTIIAGNHDGSPATQHRDCSTSRPLDSHGYNLIEDTTGCPIGGDTTGNLTGISSGLGPLQDNGGPTFTHALLPDSPAIDAGNPAGCTDHEGVLLLTDQRGFLRVQDGDGDDSKVCDIGAYELGSSLPTYVYLPLIHK